MKPDVSDVSLVHLVRYIFRLAHIDVVILDHLQIFCLKLD